MAAVHSLKRPSEVLIGHATEADLRDGLKALAAKGVEAIVQAGTDLAMADLAGEAERWLGIPVIAINVATYWSALRANGIDDRVARLRRPAGGALSTRTGRSHAEIGLADRRDRRPALPSCRACRRGRSR